MQGGIASILHRDTLAVIVGKQMFVRGEECHQAGRVEKTEAAPGELRGVVRPQEAGRRPYVVRLWMHQDGLAYECTCPVGVKLRFCKHTVAIALAHLEAEQRRAERHIPLLREALAHLPPPALVEGLCGLAERDAEWSNALKRMCLEALAQQR